MVGEWGSADRSRSAELQFAAPVVRLGPTRRPSRRGVWGEVAKKSTPQLAFTETESDVLKHHHRIADTVQKLRVTDFRRYLFGASRYRAAESSVQARLVHLVRHLVTQ